MEVGDALPKSVSQTLFQPANEAIPAMVEESKVIGKLKRMTKETCGRVCITRPLPRIPKTRQSQPSTLFLNPTLYVVGHTPTCYLVFVDCQ